MVACHEAGIERGTYWTWKREPADWNEPVSLEAGRRAILESLSEQLVADVPIGAFLSGGIDSSLLLAMLVNDLGRKVPSFTVAFGETSYDESPYAAMVARHLGTDHHEIRVPVGQGHLALIDEVLSQFDQPFGDSSAVPSYVMCRAVRPFVKVVIGGDGGDEMFGGIPAMVTRISPGHWAGRPPGLFGQCSASPARFRGSRPPSGSDKFRDCYGLRRRPATSDFWPCPVICSPKNCRTC